MPLIIKFFVQSVSGTQLQLRAIFHEAVARAEDLGMSITLIEEPSTAEHRRRLNTLGNVLINGSFRPDDCKRFADIVKNIADRYNVKIHWNGRLL